jgi:hypothetical protein
MARKQKAPPMQKRPDVAQQLAQCIEYNQQWQTVAEGYKRQVGELLLRVQQLQQERDHWKALAMGQSTLQN